MLRSKDFYLKDIFDSKGKKVGVVKDIVIDFINGTVKGFLVTNYSFFSKKNFVKVEDIIEIKDGLVVDSIGEGKGLLLSDIKNMDIIDKYNLIKGVLEDIIIDPLDYSIKGIIVNSGFVKNIITGKEILLMNRCKLRKNNIIYMGEPDIIMKTIPHGISQNEFNKKA